MKVELRDFAVGFAAMVVGSVYGLTMVALAWAAAQIAGFAFDHPRYALQVSVHCGVLAWLWWVWFRRPASGKGKRP